MRGPDPAPAEASAAAAAPPPETMVLELALPPGVPARLLRSPVLAGLRAGKARGAPFVLTWYDTVDGQLAAKGQALELAPARRGARQALRQVLPEESVAWVPGSVPPALAETQLPSPTPDPLAAGLAADTPLVALAAAEGRRRTLPIAFQGVPATLGVLEGKLRTVAAESGFARLVITAPAPAAFGMAALLAEDFALLPAAPLAEAARALAVGQAPRPVRQGAPVLSRAMPVEDGFVHAALHLCAVLLSLVPAVEAGIGAGPVHQTRVALRRLRSALAVWREVIDGERLRGLDGGLRHLARLLGPVRDRDVFMGGMLADLAAALAAEGRAPAAGLDHLRQALADQRAGAHATLTAWLASPSFRALVLELLATLAGRSWREGCDADQLAAMDAPLTEFAARVLRRRARKVLKDHEELAGMPVAVLHALRLRAKRLRYAAEFFAPLFPAKRTRRYLRRLAELQAALGEVNDCAVANLLVHDLPATRTRAAAERAWAQGAIEGFAASRATLARAAAEAAWRKLRDTAPFWVA